MNKPKLLFVYDHPHPERWMDGLWAALNLLEKDFEIERVNHPNVVVPRGGFVLGWGAFGSPVDRLLQRIDAKKGLCIGGTATPPTGASSYDVLFYETKWHRPQIAFHPNIVHAFGINSDLYHQEELPSVGNLEFATPIVWDYIGVGSLSTWKRWEKMAEKPGMRLVIGDYQPRNERESLTIARDLLLFGVMVSNTLSPIDYANLLKWSRVAYIPSDINGGGERAVLEARASGLKVEIEPDNPKLKELLESPIWDEHYYAKQLKKGIESAL